MPPKTIYVSDDDLPLYQRAQELAGGNLSAAISTALRRYVELQEGRMAGFDEVIVRVGVGDRRRQQRFTGLLLGEWTRGTGEQIESYRVYRTPKDRFVVHIERSEKWTSNDPDAEKWKTGWRSWVGNWGDQSWIHTPAETLLHVANSLEELRDLLPAELFHTVSDLANQPAIEDLDI